MLSIVSETRKVRLPSTSASGATEDEGVEAADDVSASASTSISPSCLLEGIVLATTTTAVLLLLFFFLPRLDVVVPVVVAAVPF